MKEINYDNIKNLDIICTGSNSLSSKLIRIFTKGFRYRNNKRIATHTGFLIKISNQVLVLEMLNKRLFQKGGLTISPLSKYLKNKKWIVSIKRSLYLSQMDDLALNEVIKDFRNTLEYDIKGNLAFVFNSVKENPKKYYCSEYVYKILRNYNKTLPKKINASPYFISSIGQDYETTNY